MATISVHVPGDKRITITRNRLWWQTASYLMDKYGDEYLQSWAEKQECNDPRYGFIVSKRKNASTISLERGAIVFVGWKLNQHGNRVLCMNLYVYNEMFNRMCWEWEHELNTPHGKMCDSLSRFWEQHTGKPIRRLIKEDAVKKGLFPVVGMGKPLFYKITHAWWEKGMCESAYNSVKKSSRVFAVDRHALHGFSINEIVGADTIELSSRQYGDLVTLNMWLNTIYKLSAPETNGNSEEDM